MGRNWGAGGGSSRTSEGNRATGARKAKWRELATEIIAERHFPARKGLTHPPQRVMGWALRRRLSGLDPRERTRVDGHEDTLRGLVQHKRSSGKSLGPPEGRAVTAAGALVSGRGQDSAFTSAAGGRSRRRLRLAVKKLAPLQSVIPERGTGATRAPGPVCVPEGEEVLACCGLNPRSCSCPQAVKGRASRPTPS